MDELLDDIDQLSDFRSDSDDAAGDGAADAAGDGAADAGDDGSDIDFDAALGGLGGGGGDGDHGDGDHGDGDHGAGRESDEDTRIMPAPSERKKRDHKIMGRLMRDGKEKKRLKGDVTRLKRLVDEKPVSSKGGALALLSDGSLAKRKRLSLCTIQTSPYMQPRTYKPHLRKPW